ncbi:MAG: flavodoxin family protein [Deltaproteobacteria bacterium]|nr:flavodoxin family protein [Deltaproteobacteria bacterium]
MKVVAFNGSARKEGNTSILIRHVLAELEKEGIETEVVHLAGQSIHGCLGCNKCWKTKNQRCTRNDDIINGCIEKMLAADGILLGSPTYFTDVSTEMKALIDRCGYVAKANDDMFKRKVGAAVVAVRRAGSTHAFDTMNHLFTISQMIVPGSSYWNVGVGLQKGDVENDLEGIQTMKVLGENMAWLLKKLH